VGSGEMSGRFSAAVARWRRCQDRRCYRGGRSPWCSARRARRQPRQAGRKALKGRYGQETRIYPCARLYDQTLRKMTGASCGTRPNSRFSTCNPCSCRRTFEFATR
jgi:hypothetical protein